MMSEHEVKVIEDLNLCVINLYNEPIEQTKFISLFDEIFLKT